MIRRNLAWILLGLSLALNVFFVGGFVYARYFDPPWGHHRMEMKWRQELNLDPDQQRAVREAFREMRQRNRPRVQELRQLRRQLVDELRKEKLDFAAIDPMIDRAANLRSDIQKDGLRTAGEIAATLRPDQRERFREVVINRTLAFHGPGGRRKMRRQSDE